MPQRDLQRISIYVPKTILSDLDQVADSRAVEITKALSMYLFCLKNKDLNLGSIDPDTITLAPEDLQTITKMAIGHLEADAAS